jgi:hypothetical protein
MGFCLGYGHIWTKSKVIGPAKIFCEAHNFVPRWNFDKPFVACKTWNAADADRGIARVIRVPRGRAIDWRILTSPFWNKAPLVVMYSHTHEIEARCLVPRTHACTREEFLVGMVRSTDSRMLLLALLLGRPSFGEPPRGPFCSQRCASDANCSARSDRTHHISSSLAPRLDL